MTEPLLSQRVPSALRYPQFRAFFIAASVSNGASWLQAVAVPVLLFKITDETKWLGFAVVATMLPAVLLSAPSGVIGDRVNRRVMLIATQCMQLLGAALMWGFYLSGRLTPGLILALSVINGIGTGLQAPIWQAFVPSLVPRQSMVDAIRLNSIQFTIARVVGPAAAGLVVRQLGFGWAFGINVFSFILPITVLAFLRTPPNKVDATQRLWQALGDGFRWVRGDSGMILMLFIALLTSAIGQSLQSISAAIAERVFGHPPEDNAILLTALGLGGLLAGLFTGKVSRRAHDLTALMTFTFVLYTTSPLLIAGSTTFAFGVAGYFVGGLAHLLNAVTVNSYLQTYVPDHLRGRIMGFYLLAVLAGLQIGGMTLGFLGDWIGVRNSLLLDALVIATVAGYLNLSGTMSRMLRRPAGPEAGEIVPAGAVLAVEQEA